MKRIATLFLIVLTGACVFSQDTLFVEEIPLYANTKTDRSALPVFDALSGNLCLFLFDNCSIGALLISPDFKKLGRQWCKKLHPDYNYIWGGKESTGLYKLYYFNHPKNLVHVTTIDFSGKKTTEQEIQLPNKKEQGVSAWWLNDTLFVLSMLKESPTLNLYRVLNSTFEKTIAFDLSAIDFVNFKYQGYTSATVGPSPFKYGVQVRAIVTPEQNDLAYTYSTKKLFYAPGKIFLTFDEYNDATSIVILNLHDGTSSFRRYPYGLIQLDEPYSVQSANSVIFDNTLFQCRVSAAELLFEIKDLDSDTLIRSFRAKSDEEVYFSNTPMVQEGGKGEFRQGSELELTSTQSFLRKTAHSNMAIAVSSAGSKRIVIIGGVFEKKQTSIFNPVGIFPQFFNLEYMARRKTYITGLFSYPSYEHFPEKIEESDDSRILDFLTRLKYPVYDLEITFSYNGSEIFGYYHPEKKKFFLMKFPD